MTAQKGSVPVGEGLAPADPHPCSCLHFPKGAGASQEAFHRQVKIQTAFWKVPSGISLVARVEVGRQRGCRSRPSRGDSTGPGSGWQQEEHAGREPGRGGRGRREQGPAGAALGEAGTELSSVSPHL